MNWLIEYKLRKLGERSNPDRAFVRSLEARIRTASGHPTWWIHGWKWAVSRATIVTLVGSGTGAYAYSSDEVLPDHPLYGVRQQIENAEEAFAFTTERKANVQIKRLNRRLHENEILTARKKPLPKEDPAQFSNALQKMIDETSGLPEESQELVDKAIDTLQENREKALMKQRDDAQSPEDKTRFDETLKTEKERIKKTIESLQEARKLHFNRIRMLRIERLQQRHDRTSVAE